MPQNQTSDILLSRFNNTGNVPIEGPFSVIDNKLDEWQCGEAGFAGFVLGVGKTMTCKGYYMVKPEDVGSDITNTAYVEGTLEGKTVSSNEISATVYSMEKGPREGGGEGEGPVEEVPPGD
jgi:hypothetical protein